MVAPRLVVTESRPTTTTGMTFLFTNAKIPTFESFVAGFAGGVLRHSIVLDRFGSAKLLLFTNDLFRSELFATDSLTQTTVIVSIAKKPSAQYTTLKAIFSPLFFVV
eukprot:Lithocolla_globosa_v1_NODE_5862_length_1172_cov_160.822898.p3 type:complete len:107 gc:universal NODE_5862_length_1172_cov_160.822898:718-398(-)